jgi:hypothetical protein
MAEQVAREQILEVLMEAAVVPVVAVVIVPPEEVAVPMEAAAVEEERLRLVPLQAASAVQDLYILRMNHPVYGTTYQC